MGEGRGGGGTFGVGDVIVADLRVGRVTEDAVVTVAEDTVAIEDAVGAREEHPETLAIDDPVAGDLGVARVDLGVRGVGGVGGVLRQVGVVGVVGVGGCWNYEGE